MGLSQNGKFLQDIQLGFDTKADILYESPFLRQPFFGSKARTHGLILAQFLVLRYAYRRLTENGEFPL
jgi:hypothetical protein